MSLAETLGNEAWMLENAPRIKQMFPETWTHIDNISALKIAFQMKLIGIDWRSPEEFARSMSYFHAVGLLQRKDRYLYRRSP